jgi:hypothetical protein
MFSEGGHMKTVTLTTLIAVALIGIGTAVAEQSTASLSIPAHHLSSKHVRLLTESARTGQDHRELAQYFRQEAQRNREKEQYYQETAAIYRLHPPRVDMYRNESIHDYYNHLADEARALALAEDHLAKFQDSLAERVATEK